jgi:pimeloyl-ACP methyl ester carboxylesterase
MPLDERLVANHRRFEDEDAGISEEFLQPVLGSARTLAVLYRPLVDPRDVGWVICHSFGMEQTFLMEHEVAAARALAGAGFPVLRYHGNGYGDSEGDPRAIGLTSHVAEAADAVAVLAAEAGVVTPGTLGARFGGMVAALVADRHTLPLLAMWEPVTQGSRYMRDLLRSRDLFQMLQAGDPNAERPVGPDPLEELRVREWTDLKGFFLTRGTHDEIAAVDLLRDLTRFSGSALLVSVSRSGARPQGLARLAEHLRSLGATCEEETVRDDEAVNFGQYHYDNDEDPNAKRDLQSGLAAAIASSTTSWCRRLLAPTIVGEAPTARP